MKITACIPTYRGAHRLRPLLASMISVGLHEDPNFSVLVCDDGSPPEDAARIAAEATAFSAPEGPLPLRAWRHDHVGWPVTVNRMVRQCSPGIVWILDDDTLVPAGMTAVMRQLLAIENIGALSWRSRGMNPGQSAKDVPGFLEPATQLSGYALAFRRERFDEVGGIDETYKMYCSDSDFCLRLTRAGHPCYRVWWPLVPHAEHQSVRDAPELDADGYTAHDAAYFRKKWGADGNDMELLALSALKSDPSGAE